MRDRIALSGLTGSQEMCEILAHRDQEVTFDPAETAIVAREPHGTSTTFVAGPSSTSASNAACPSVSGIVVIHERTSTEPSPSHASAWTECRDVRMSQT
jgi:hypothetical protein